MSSLERKIEAIERRLTKFMAKNQDLAPALQPSFDAVHNAYVAITEGRESEALDEMNKFNHLIKMYKGGK